MAETGSGTSGRRGLVIGAVVLLAAVGFGVGRWWDGASRAALVDVEVPTLSALARKGAKAFDANCARCHGQNGAGTDRGPPLVYDTYNPGHHGDGAFVSAARFGVQQHHWRFGDMPAQPQVTDEELVAIIRYVRELQEANGIFYKPHIMQ